MKRFLLSKPGLVCLLLFTVGLGFLCQRLVTKATRRRAEEAQLTGPSLTKPEAGLERSVGPKSKTTEAKTLEPTEQEKEKSPANETQPRKLSNEMQEDLNSLDRSKALGEQSRQDKDRLGRTVTRRRTPAARGSQTALPADPTPVAATKPQAPLRLNGQGSGFSVAQEEAGAASSGRVGQGTDGTTLRFCPFGRPIKCELVFTVDSANLATPIIALVMEPVYNNGRLVIPAGTELHGTARVETMRDRICSTESWTMVLPREPGLPNGRQLSIRGEMLDRDEPDANGMTWGILDGSFGLRGQCIRTMEREEVERFVATFLGGAVSALEQRQTTYGGEQHLVENGRNAALTGLASNMRQLVDEITQEIQKNGAFIRVGGGKQFYFYPKQAILPEEAALPTRSALNQTGMGTTQGISSIAHPKPRGKTDSPGKAQALGLPAVNAVDTLLQNGGLLPGDNGLLP